MLLLMLLLLLLLLLFYLISVKNCKSYAVLLRFYFCCTYFLSLLLTLCFFSHMSLHINFRLFLVLCVCVCAFFVPAFAIKKNILILTSGYCSARSDELQHSVCEREGVTRNPAGMQNKLHMRKYFRVFLVFRVCVCVCVCVFSLLFFWPIQNFILLCFFA